jgi:hypothetical protein
MREHAVTDALTVSFQRYPYPPSGWVEALPRSRGALPLALAAPDRLLLACPAGEALWIGLVATRRQERSSRVGVVARLASGERVDLATGAEPADGLPRPAFAVPPRVGVEGLARQDGGWWALALAASGPQAPACVGLELAVWTGPAAARQGRSGPDPLHRPSLATPKRRPGPRSWSVWSWSTPPGSRRPPAGVSPRRWVTTPPTAGGGCPDRLRDRVGSGGGRPAAGRPSAPRTSGGVP